MEFERIRNDLKEISFTTLRLDCDNNFEAVIVRQELEKLKERLEKFFGQPIWPSKERLPFHVERVINDFGGIMPGQTLYYWSRQQDIIFAMLWPWHDGLHTTVKVIKHI